MAEQKQMHTAALLSFLPFHSGDGYAFGGGAVITVNGLSIPFGEGTQAASTAKEMALRWNAYEDMLAALSAVDTSSRWKYLTRETRALVEAAAAKAKGDQPHEFQQNGPDIIGSDICTVCGKDREDHLTGTQAVQTVNPPQEVAEELQLVAGSTEQTVAGG